MVCCAETVGDAARETDLQVSRTHSQLPIDRPRYSQSVQSEPDTPNHAYTYRQPSFNLANYPSPLLSNIAAG